jgi:hypothetical protein
MVVPDGRKSWSDDLEVDEGQLCPSVDGVRFPAAKWQLVAWAEYNGAGLPIRSALWRLPERMYHDITEVVGAVKSEQQEPSRAPSSKSRAKPRGMVGDQSGDRTTLRTRSPRAVPIVSLTSRVRRLQ